MLQAILDRFPRNTVACLSVAALAGCGHVGLPPKPLSEAPAIPEQPITVMHRPLECVRKELDYALARKWSSADQGQKIDLQNDEYTLMHISDFGGSDRSELISREVARALHGAFPKDVVKVAFAEADGSDYINIQPKLQSNADSIEKIVRYYAGNMTDQQISAARAKAKKQGSALNIVTPRSQQVMVRGVFTQDDSNPVQFDGLSNTGGVNGKNGTATIAQSTARTNQVLGLTLEIARLAGPPVTDETITLTINMPSSNSNGDYRLGIGDFFISLGESHSRTPSKAAMRRVLIEAGVYWLAHKLIGNPVLTTRCITGDISPVLAAQQDATWASLKEDDRLAAVATLLEKNGYYQPTARRPRLKAGKIPPDLQAAIGAAQKELIGRSMLFAPSMDLRVLYHVLANPRFQRR